VENERRERHTENEKQDRQAGNEKREMQAALWRMSGEISKRGMRSGTFSNMHYR
jgi:hypothetical protein